MKRILIATLVALSVPLATSTSNANAAAAACSKVGATKIVSGAKFTCRLVSKKRIWVKGPAGGLLCPGRARSSIEVIEDDRVARNREATTR